MTAQGQGPSPGTGARWRQVAGWAALGVLPAVIQVVVYLVTDDRPRALIVDMAELSDDIGMFTSVFARLAIILWFGAAVAVLLAASVLPGRDPLRSALQWAGGLSLFLGLDDGLVLHENVPLPDAVPDAILLLPAALVAGILVLRHRDVLRPEWPLGLLSGGALAVSVVVDLVFEGILESHATGVLFAEENAKFVGVIAWFGACLHASRRAITVDGRAG